ncbi:hypothetical protein ES702_07816 [subsurface metagenome]
MQKHEDERATILIWPLTLELTFFDAVGLLGLAENGLRLVLGIGRWCFDRSTVDRHLDQ